MKMKIFFLFLLLLPSPVFAGEGVLKIYIKNATTGLVKVWVDPHRIVTRGHMMFTVAGVGANQISVPFSKSHFSIIEGRKK